LGGARIPVEELSRSSNGAMLGASRLDAGGVDFRGGYTAIYTSPEGNVRWLLSGLEFGSRPWLEDVNDGRRQIRFGAGTFDVPGIDHALGIRAAIDVSGSDEAAYLVAFFAHKRIWRVAAFGIGADASDAVGVAQLLRDRLLAAGEYEPPPGKPFPVATLVTLVLMASALAAVFVVGYRLKRRRRPPTVSNWTIPPASPPPATPDA
jgi:hypothetical protein